MLQESILQYFRPSLSYHLSLRPLFFLFLIGHFTQFYFSLYFLNHIKVPSNQIVEMSIMTIFCNIFLKFCEYIWLTFQVYHLPADNHMNCQVQFDSKPVTKFENALCNNFLVVLFDLILNVPVNNFSVMSGGAVLG